MASKAGIFSLTSWLFCTFFCCLEVPSYLDLRLIIKVRAEAEYRAWIHLGSTAW